MNTIGKTVTNVLRSLETVLTQRNVCSILNRSGLGRHDIHVLIFKLILKADKSSIEASDARYRAATAEKQRDALTAAHDAAVAEVDRLKAQLTAAQKANQRSSSLVRDKILDKLYAVENAVFDAENIVAEELS